MCSSFTWGTVSVHYLLGLPLAYALRSATPNGLMLLVKLTYSPVMLRPIDSFYLTYFFLNLKALHRNTAGRHSTRRGAMRTLCGRMTRPAFAQDAKNFANACVCQAGTCHSA